MSIFPFLLDGFLARRRFRRDSGGGPPCPRSTPMPPGPPRVSPRGLPGPPRGLSRSFQEPLGVSGSYVKRNATVKAEVAAGGSGRLQEALGGSRGLWEAPRGSGVLASKRSPAEDGILDPTSTRS